MPYGRGFFGNLSRKADAPPGEPQPGHPATGTSDVKIRQVLSKIKVCIIGAGISGLRTAMYLQKLGIDYDILEAADRHGGRVYTHRFSDTKRFHDYFDVGAMRFPKVGALDDTFALFEELDLKEDKELIPYILGHGDNIGAFNGKIVRECENKTLIDPYGDNDQIHYNFLNYKFTRRGTTEPLKGASALAAAAMAPFKDALAKDGADKNSTGKAWEMLMKYDDYSMRDYLLRQFIPRCTLNCTEYCKSELAGKCVGVCDPVCDGKRCRGPCTDNPTMVVQWMERTASSTGSYDFAFSQAVLASMVFDYPKGPDDLASVGKPTKWHCIEGGTSVVIDRMVARLSKKPYYNHRVTAIRRDEAALGAAKMFVSIHGGSTFESIAYSHVVATAPLSCMNFMDLTGAGLSPIHKDAIRTLAYGSSVKVGIKFKTRWWQNLERFAQRGGVSRTDRPARVVVYPSYGLGSQDCPEDPKDAPGVLIASYTWTQDASRLGALCQGKGTKAEEYLLSILYADLAVIHPEHTAQWYKEQTISYYAHDFVHNEFSVGAYAQFRPGQYRDLFPGMLLPAADGYLHFAGEALSFYHAWIEGSLRSAWSAVDKIFVTEGIDKMIEEVGVLNVNGFKVHYKYREEAKEEAWRYGVCFPVDPNEK